LESTIDILAGNIGIDPMEFRAKNMIKEGEGSPIFKIMGEGTEGVDMVMESCKLDFCMKRGLELCGWKQKFPRKQVAANKVRGIGGAIAMQGSGIPAIDMAAATIKLNDGGFFNLMVGATDIGTGSDTILAQIAAEVLDVSTDKIIVYSSDTDLTPFDCGAYASSTTYVSGNAVKNAAIKMKAQIEEVAAEKLGVAAEDVEMVDGVIKAKSVDASITLSDLSTQLYYSHKQKQLMTCESFSGEVSPPPFMAGFAEIEIDTETGKVDLIDYIAIVDCGITINPNLALIQVEGGLVQGIGMTLYEEVKYAESGKLLSNNFMKYNLPTRNEIRKLTVEFAKSYEPTGPHGAKSVGEIGIDTPPAAIANAIYNAIGVRFTKLPITSEDILLALRKKRS
jgi:CO/xanthine dehydrogenase Mo-binding subunit